MRLPAYIFLCIVTSLPVSVIGQYFGCYETPRNSGSSNILSSVRENDHPEFQYDFSDFKITQTRDCNDTEYYKIRPYYPIQLKMVGRIVNGKQQGKWLLYSENKGLRYYGSYSNGLKEGDWKGIYIDENGDTVKYWTGTFVNDKLDGVIRSGLNNNGSVVWKIHYSDGLLNGAQTEYYPDGKVEKTINYKEGKRNGEEIEYDETPSSNGFRSFSYDTVSLNNDTIYKPVVISYYKNDTLAGPCISMNDWDGLAIESYAGGKRNGKCTYYSKDKGSRVKSIDYIVGILSGEYSKYYNNGLLAYTIICKNGLPFTSVCAYSNNGKVLDQGTLKEGNGVLKCYYANGQLKSESTYKNQCYFGVYRGFTDSNKITQEGELFGVNDSTAKPSENEYLIESNNFNVYAARSMKWIGGHGVDSSAGYREKYEVVNNDTSYYNHCMHVVTYNSGGNKLSDNYSKADYRFGTSIDYYNDNELKDVENYEVITQNGEMKSVKNGLCKYYFKSGKVKADIYFADDKESGHSKYYDEAGNIMRELYVLSDGSSYNVFSGDTVNRIDRNGRKEGKWISLGGIFLDYSDNDRQDCDINPESIKFYKDGEPVGVWYSRQGEDSIKLIWIDSIKASYYDYNEGKLKEEGYVLDQYHNVGHWKVYNTDVKKSYLEWEGDYEADEHQDNAKSGIWKHYKKNGKIKEIVNYTQGQIMKT